MLNVLVNIEYEMAIFGTEKVIIRTWVRDWKEIDEKLDEYNQENIVWIFGTNDYNTLQFR